MIEEGFFVTCFDEVRVVILPHQNSSFYVYGVFVDSRGRGTPDKRIPLGLFWRISKKFAI